MPSTERVKWDRQRATIQAERNAEMQRAEPPRTRSFARQALREMNARSQVGEPAPHTVYGVLPDLFY